MFAGRSFQCKADNKSNCSKSCVWRVFFLQLWLKEELAKKADIDSGPVAQIGEHFIAL